MPAILEARAILETLKSKKKKCRGEPAYACIFRQYIRILISKVAANLGMLLFSAFYRGRKGSCRATEACVHHKF